MYVQGAPIKGIPLGKLDIYTIVADFKKLNLVFTKEDSGHICSKFRYNIWFDLEITTVWT